MDLKPETPATGILIKNNWGDAKQYIVTCECGQSDHSHEIFVEADESGITVTTYTTQKDQLVESNPLASYLDITHTRLHQVRS